MNFCMQFISLDACGACGNVRVRGSATFSPHCRCSARREPAEYRCFSATSGRCLGAAMSPSRRGLAGALTPGVHQRCGYALCAYVCVLRSRVQRRPHSPPVGGVGRALRNNNFGPLYMVSSPPSSRPCASARVKTRYPLENPGERRALITPLRRVWLRPQSYRSTTARPAIPYARASR
jgi:hypothetical protein